MLPEGPGLRAAAVHDRPRRGRRVRRRPLHLRRHARSSRARTRADLRYVEGVVRDLAPYLRRRCLVVGKSTVPVGTAARLTQLVQDIAPAGHGGRAGLEPRVPARGVRRRGHAAPGPTGLRRDLGVGARRSSSAAFAPILEAGTPVVVTDLATAELVKVAANSFLATKISYINAMAEVCEATGADVQTLAKALAYDGRIGGRFLKPGLGFGGGCLPKDIRAFMHRAEELGVGKSVAFLRAGRRDQQAAPRSAPSTSSASRPAATWTGSRCAALGAAFKPNSDDIRDAPALDVARMLQQEGADREVYDPEAMDNARRAYPDLHYADGVCEARRGRRRGRAAHRVGPVPRHRPRPARRGRRRTVRSSTAGTRSTPTPGGPPAGRTGPSAAPLSGTIVVAGHATVPARGRPLVHRRERAWSTAGAGSLPSPCP